MGARKYKIDVQCEKKSDISKHTCVTLIIGQNSRPHCEVQSDWITYVL